MYTKTLTTLVKKSKKCETKSIAQPNHWLIWMLIIHIICSGWFDFGGTTCKLNRSNFCCFTDFFKGFSYICAWYTLGYDLCALVSCVCCLHACVRIKGDYDAVLLTTLFNKHVPTGHSNWEQTYNALAIKCFHDQWNFIINLGSQFNFYDRKSNFYCGLVSYISSKKNNIEFFLTFSVVKLRLKNVHINV